jgi:membrane protein implicated in regulation of membrane protease activity
MSQQDILNLINAAAKENDRWWTVAMFVILLGMMVVIWRFVMSDRKKLTERLEQVTDEHIASCTRLTEVVANNTAVLHEVMQTISVCRYRGQQKDEG